MAGRVRVLTAKAAGRLLNYIRIKSAEPAEQAIALEMMGYAQGAHVVETLEGKDIPLTWVGSAAAAMGLTGEATPGDAAMALKEGHSPTTGEALRTKSRAPRNKKTGEQQERRAAYSWVIGAPKTISLLLASKDVAVRYAAHEALERAADCVLRELEGRVTVRRGGGGKISEGVRGLLGVRVTHYTSSAGDPHLHAYYILSSSAPAASDGQWRALDRRILFSKQRFVEAVFNAALYRELHARLELDSNAWQMVMVGSVPTWEIKALLPAIERFSRARAHMAEIATRLEE